MIHAREADETIHDVGGPRQDEFPFSPLDFLSGGTKAPQRLIVGGGNCCQIHHDMVVPCFDQPQQAIPNGQPD